MNELILEEIAKRYMKDGILKGKELLLPPDKIIGLVDDLLDQGISIVGCDLWRYVDREKGWIVQLVGAGLAIEDTKKSPGELASLVKNYLTNELPGDAELVSLLFEDIRVYDCFKP